MQVANETAYEYYGYLSFLAVIGVIIGGFFGDLILGARNGLLTGFALCAAGALFTTIPYPVVFYTGIVLIALGSGFTRANTFSLIGHGTPNGDTVLLERRFITMHGAVNFGAFLGVLLIGYLGETFGFIYSFIVVVALYGLSLCLTLVISPKKTSTILNRIEVDKEPRSITKSLLIVILTIITCAAFWMIFEQYSEQVSIYKIEYSRSISSSHNLIWMVTSIIMLLLVIPYYFVAKRLSIYLKLAIGMGVIGVCWLVAVLLGHQIISLGFLSSLLLLMFAESLAELLVSPIAQTILSVHTTKRYYGLVFGAYSAVIAIGTRILLYSEHSFMEYVVYVALIVVVVASIILYSILSATQRDRKAPLPKLDE